MRCLPRLPTGLLAILLLFVPFTSQAYSEWPAFSSHATQLSLERKLPLKCCLESHVGNIYLQEPIRDFGIFAEFMMELGHYLRQHTSAGSYYLIRVHFEDHVRSISVRDLERFHHKVHWGLNDPRVIYEFISLFQNH
jgi:hypothetical protein